MTAWDSRLGRALETIAASKGNVVALTGAGISAESGIPTFRGPEGYWTVGSRQYHPQELATRAAFRRLPRQVWAWYLYRRGVCRRAEPNDGHRALVRLAQAFGDRFTLITQNVDGLHLRAGHDPQHTLQIHGNIDFGRCSQRCSDATHPLDEDLQLGDRDEPLDDARFERLRCPECGAPSRPHVLWFDEYYDEGLFRAESAMRVAASADLLLVVGSSGTTNLPMQIAMLTARRGRPIVDVNPESGPFAEIAALTEGFEVRQSASSALPPIVDALVGAAC